MEQAPKVYCTSYCNQGHRMRDGKPVAHECYIIPPEALRLEREGDVPAALEVMRQTLLLPSRGVKA